MPARPAIVTGASYEPWFSTVRGFKQGGARPRPRAYPLAGAASAHRDPESRRTDGKLLRATARHGLSVFIGIDIIWIYASDAPLRTSDDAHPSLRGVTLTMRAAPGGDATGAVRDLRHGCQPHAVRRPRCAGADR